ncbi:DNA polymerase III subunit gamma/tau [Acidisoma cellulosilytica]|uniref:DNA polymerase III subunit gamma/tau n=1 Tax=Acidisoma cellulosilyticum TaxID=2802395 RepID=A0A963YXK0_9PROT|nr:DNA polymerase III subunit gamma/tau [Acidisoma cellulosilyticum]MCB8878929.1 DNA polymerase III subunit gamma/tau [Acidisoma cellulosilyticum]
MTETDPSSADLLPEPPAIGPGLFGDAPAPALPAKAAPYRVLARTYRPSRFEDLIGQDAMVRILRRAFATGRIAHAFMLTGVRGTGKTTTARIIARCLNCTGPDGQGGPTADPCGVCSNCRAIMADRHPDVIEMDAASRTGVDDVREIIEATRFRPMEARVKVFIIDEVHMLSRNAFNALLKTLEEPPPHVKFVFATTELRKVPITVLSRCQKFDLRRVSTTELAAHFGRIAATEKVSVSPEALEIIARAADGSVRDGLSLLDQAIVMGSVQDGSGAPQPITADAVADMLGLADQGLVFDLFERIMTGDAASVLAALDQAHERGADAGLVLQDLLSLTHNLSRLKASLALRNSPDLPQILRGRGAELADRLSIPVLGRAWQMLLKGVQEVEQAPDRRAAAEMVLIRLCYLSDQPSPGDLVKRLTSGGELPRPAAPSLALPSGGDGPRAVMAGGGGGGGMAMLRAVPDASPIDVMPAAVPQALVTPAAMPEPTEPTPVVVAPASFREVISLVRELKEMTLYGHLLHSVHLVRFAAPVIEIRPKPDAPRDVASRLAGLLAEATGQRWTIAISTAAGEATIDEQRTAADNQREQEASEHPLVLAIMDAFPGAKLEGVRDPMADEYRLPPMVVTDDHGADAETESASGALLPDDLPDFAPPDAELTDDTDMEIE